MRPAVFLRLTDSGERYTATRRSPRERDRHRSDTTPRGARQLHRRPVGTRTDDTVEVAHEALLREWPRLREWLDEDREGRRLHRQLAGAAAAWEGDNRDDAGLYRGIRLQAGRARIRAR